MIEALKKIGLSDLEARCYLALLDEPDLSGYEVAKRVSVSRTNVYAALRALSDKGACRTINGDPVMYDAVPIEQLVKLLQTGFEQTAQHLMENLKSVPRMLPAFYNWQGRKPIETTIHRLIANAEKSIIVDLWSEDLHWVEAVLLEAERRGVNVTVIVIGECQTPLKNVVVHLRDDEWPASESRKYSILCDSAVSLIGSFGTNHKLSAVETDHPAVSELLKNAFFHDIVMHEIERDFHDELTAKYGDKYKLLFEKYAKQNGFML